MKMKENWARYTYSIDFFAKEKVTLDILLLNFNEWQCLFLTCLYNVSRRFLVFCVRSATR